MLSLLKSVIASKEIDALERNKSLVHQYRRWLSEFPMISLMLDNMLTVMEGRQPLDACHPPMSNGPWTIDNLRYKLREMRLNAKPADGMVDENWQQEFDKKHEQMTAAQAEVIELKAKLNDAAELVLAKNREVNEMRLVCGEAYQVIAVLDPTNRKALDNLYAASVGEPISCLTFRR